MDPQSPFCPNPQCPNMGQTAQGHVKVDSFSERRFRCTTFAASTGTPFYRLHKDPSLLDCVVTAFGLDEGTVAT